VSLETRSSASNHGSRGSSISRQPPLDWLEQNINQLKSGQRVGNGEMLQRVSSMGVVEPVGTPCRTSRCGAG